MQSMEQRLQSRRGRNGSTGINKTERLNLRLTEAEKSLLTEVIGLFATQGETVTQTDCIVLALEATRQVLLGMPAKDIKVSKVVPEVIERFDETPLGRMLIKLKPAESVKSDKPKKSKSLIEAEKLAKQMERENPGSTSIITSDLQEDLATVRRGKERL